MHHIFHDFSFVIYNAQTQTYFAARDTMGTRPLYYSIFDNQLYYSHDIGELLYQVKIKKEPNIDSLDTLIHYGSIPYDATMYKSIKRLPSGHWMIVDKEGNIEIERYWKPEEIKVDKSITKEKAKEKFLYLMRQAISTRINEVSMTSFELSGGLDSSSIVSLARQMYPNDTIHCTSMTFSGMLNCDETEYIDSMQEELELDIHKVNIENLDYKDQYSFRYNYQINPYWPILATYTMWLPVAQKLKELGMKRVLTGQGGDHILSGNRYAIYDYFKGFQWIQLYKELKVSKKPVEFFKKYVLIPLLSENQKKFIKSILRRMHLREVDKSNALGFEKKYHEFSEYYPKNALALWYDLDILTGSVQSLFMDNNYYHVIEKHYGITFTHPFYDRRVVEFMMSLPVKFRYAEGVRKVLLRSAMVGILPEKIRQRKDKAEFSEVIRQQIDAIDLDQLLNDSKLSGLGLIEQREIDRLKNEYCHGRMKRIVHFWKIINLEYWYRYNFAPETLEDRKKVQNDDRV